MTDTPIQFEWLCVEEHCEAIVAEQGEYCDTHETDEWGVRLVDCDCSISWADNSDVEVCGLHRKAYARANYPPKDVWGRMEKVNDD